MRLLIVGTGYVGLVTGTCFAEMGHEVICLDVDRNKIEKLKAGQIPIYEPGLEEMVRRNRRRLQFTTSYKEAVKASDICFLCLPTPPDEDGSCDISYVLEAAQSISDEMEGYTVIVNKSTVPVGTAEKVREVMEGDFDVVSNPEFLKEGSAISDCLKPDRIIIGSDSERATALMRKIYAAFSMSSDRIQVMDIPSAELTKYAANAMLALRISFMNELSSLSEAVGADIDQVRRGIGADKRIGSHFLYAGAGYGGSCFPKDVKALGQMFHERGLKESLITATEEVNARQKRVLGSKINSYFNGMLEGKVIAIWGLAFKPDTDDMREAPSLVLIDELLEAGAEVKVFDPVARPEGLEVCENEYEAALGADAIALVTEWKQFRFVDLERVAKGMRGRAFFDGRGQYDAAEMAKWGLEYFPIGRRCGHLQREYV